MDRQAASQLGKTDSARHLMFKASCSQHFRYLTSKGVHQRAGALQCKICPGHGKQLSSHAQQAAVGLAATHVPWAYEARVLGKHFGPMDFVFPSLTLAVEVDGEQHYGEGGWAKGQAQRDREKMQAAWDLGWRVLRVPYFLADAFSDMLAEALQVAAARPHCKFIMWAGDTKHEYALLEWRGDSAQDYGPTAQAARAAAKVSDLP